MNSSVTRTARLGDVELVLGEQPEEEVERALEDVEVDLERDRGRAARFGTGVVEHRLATVADRELVRHGRTE